MVEKPLIHATTTGEIPSYSQEDFLTMVADQEDEMMFDGKAELLTYCVTRFLGEHGGFDETADLFTNFPCDYGVSDPDYGFRLMGDLGKMETSDVILELSSYMASCISDLEMENSEQEVLFLTVGGSMVMEGYTYDLFSSVDENGYQGDETDNFFISYGYMWDNSSSPGIFRAKGFKYDIVHDVITYQELSPSEIEGIGMLRLGSRTFGEDPSPLTLNDPCHEGYNSGGTSTGSGTGGQGTDQDGVNKNGFAGGLANPQSGQTCSGPDGLRITQMHLARRYENGSTNKSEVYVNGTAWVNGGALSTMQTNDRAYGVTFKTITYEDLDYSGLDVDLKLGKQLASVAPGLISASTLSGTILTPTTSGILPSSGDDWVILGDGFCSGNNGLDRIFLTFYERDAGFFGRYLHDHVDSPIPPLDEWQPTEMRFETDVWGRFVVTPSSFTNNIVYLICEVASPHIYTMSATQPTDPNLTWFKLELF